MVKVGTTTVKEGTGTVITGGGWVIVIPVTLGVICGGMLMLGKVTGNPVVAGIVVFGGPPGPATVIVTDLVTVIAMVVGDKVVGGPSTGLVTVAVVPLVTVMKLVLIGLH